MAETQIDTNDALAKKAWDEKMHRDTMKEVYWNKFLGTGPDALVHRKTQLEKEQGDTVTFGLIPRLTNDPVIDDQPLEGNEVDLRWYSDSVAIHHYRWGIKDKGKLHRQRAVFSIKDESKNALKTRVAEGVDQLFFTAAFDSPTLTAYITNAAGFNVNATAATAKSAITTADSKITPDFITRLKTYAQTGGARSIIPLRPIKFKGKKYYILLAHNDLIADLKLNSVVRSAWENAVERGYDNPLFNDAEIMWDGVLIHSHENCPIGTNAGAGANVPYGLGLFMGAQSLVYAEGGDEGARSEVVEETFDYKNRVGYGWGTIMGVKKPKFNSKDYGSIGIVAARTKTSDA